MTSVSGKQETNHIHEMMPSVRSLILLGSGFWCCFRGWNHRLKTEDSCEAFGKVFVVAAIFSEMEPVCMYATLSSRCLHPALHFYGQITITEVKVWCDLWFPLGLLTGTKISIDARLLFVRAARNVAGRSQCWPSSCQFPLSGAPSSLASSLLLSCNLSLSIYICMYLPLLSSPWFMYLSID